MIFKFGYPYDRIDHDETRIAVGYLAEFKRDIIIEQEDPAFSEERRHDGLKLGLEHLRLFVLWVLSRVL